MALIKKLNYNVQTLVICPTHIPVLQCKKNNSQHCLCVPGSRLACSQMQAQPPPVECHQAFFQYCCTSIFQILLEVSRLKTDHQVEVGQSQVEVGQIRFPSQEENLFSQCSLLFSLNLPLDKPGNLQMEETLKSEGCSIKDKPVLCNDMLLNS